VRNRAEDDRIADVMQYVRQQNVDAVAYFFCGAYIEKGARSFVGKK